MRRIENRIVPRGTPLVLICDLLYPTPNTQLQYYFTAKVLMNCIALN